MHACMNVYACCLHAHVHVPAKLFLWACTYHVWHTYLASLLCLWRRSTGHPSVLCFVA